MKGFGRIRRRHRGAPNEAGDGVDRQSPTTDLGATVVGEPVVSSGRDADADPGSTATPGDDGGAHDDRETARLETVPAAEAREPDERLTTRRRSRARRRLRYLRRARELMLRDLGGLVFELHRTGGPDERERHDALVRAKVERVRRIDAEARQLEAVVRAPAGVLVVREAGVGGSCPSCGELYASDARFCSSCGTRVDTGTAAQAPAEELAVTGAKDRVLRAAGGDPSDALNGGSGGPDPSARSARTDPIRADDARAPDETSSTGEPGAARSPDASGGDDVGGPAGATGRATLQDDPREEPTDADRTRAFRPLAAGRDKRR